MEPDDYGPAAYGDRFAEVYDHWYRLVGDTEAAVQFLSELAADGPALELGVGTGRLALPLAERGVPVHGIDASEAMVARLRAKPGGADVPVTVGNFAEVAVEGSFSLVFVAIFTFFALLTQDDQLRCFTNVARRLRAGAAFVIEGFGPSYPEQFADGQKVRTEVADTDRVVLEVGRYDRVDQRAFLQYVVMSEKGIDMYPTRIRYASPGELDLMGRLAGLRLRERWGGWRREPFTATSFRHVSVYERASPR